MPVAFQQDSVELTEEAQYLPSHCGNTPNGDLYIMGPFSVRSPTWTGEDWGGGLDGTGMVGAVHRLPAGETEWENITPDINTESDLQLMVTCANGDVYVWASATDGHWQWNGWQMRNEWVSEGGPRLFKFSSETWSEIELPESAEGRTMTAMATDYDTDDVYISATAVCTSYENWGCIEYDAETCDIFVQTAGTGDFEPLPDNELIDSVGWYVKGMVAVNGKLYVMYYAQGYHNYFEGGWMPEEAYLVIHTYDSVNGWVELKKIEITRGDAQWNSACMFRTLNGEVYVALDGSTNDADFTQTNLYQIESNDTITNLNVVYWTSPPGSPAWLNVYDIVPTMSPGTFLTDGILVGNLVTPGDNGYNLSGKSFLGHRYQYMWYGTYGIHYRHIMTFKPDGVYM